jgi:hypothetical protein
MIAKKRKPLGSAMEEFVGSPAESGIFVIIYLFNLP